jgi:hypothetical protein
MSERAPQSTGFTPDTEQLLAQNAAAHEELSRQAAAQIEADRAAYNAKLQAEWLGDQSTEGKSHSELADQAATVKSWQEYAKQRPRSQKAVDARSEATEKDLDNTSELDWAQEWAAKLPIELVRDYGNALTHDDKTLKADVLAEIQRRAEVIKQENGHEAQVEYLKEFDARLRPVIARVNKAKESKPSNAVEAEPAAVESTVEPEPQTPAVEKEFESAEDRTEQARKAVEAAVADGEDTDEPQSDPEVADDEQEPKAKVILPPMPEEKPAKTTKKILGLKDRPKKLIGSRKKKQGEGEDQKPKASKPTQGLGTRSAAEIRELTGLSDWSDKDLEALDAEYQSQMPGSRVEPPKLTYAERKERNAKKYVERREGEANVINARMKGYGTQLLSPREREQLFPPTNLSEEDIAALEAEQQSQMPVNRNQSGTSNRSKKIRETVSKTVKTGRERLAQYRKDQARNRQAERRNGSSLLDRIQSEDEEAQHQTA